MNINTSRITVRILSLLALLVSLAMALSTESQAVGIWNCVSTETPLGDLVWVVTIREDGGKLSGTASCDEVGSSDLSEVKLDADTLSFVFYPYATHVVVKTKIRQGSMTGTWEMDGVLSGEFSGSKSKE